MAKILGIILKDGQSTLGRKIKNVGFGFLKLRSGVLGAEGGLEILSGAKPRKIVCAIKHKDRRPFRNGDAGRELAAGKGDCFGVFGLITNCAAHGGEDLLAGIGTAAGGRLGGDGCFAKRLDRSFGGGFAGG